jgi:E3 ubiquitin-protein ligase DOA10
MKASDSVNSLTELNPHEKSCFICLSSDLEEGEPLVDSKLLRNCGCNFAVHPACWNEWMKDKSDYDCPICRKDSMMRIKIPPNPVLVFSTREEPRPFCSLLKAAACLVFTVGAICLVIAIVLWG